MKKFNFGVERFKGLRVMQMANAVTFAMVSAITLHTFGFHWWYLILVVPAIFALRKYQSYDAETTFRQELQFTYDRHPLKKDHEEMLVKLNYIIQVAEREKDEINELRLEVNALRMSKVGVLEKRLANDKKIQAIREARDSLREARKVSCTCSCMAMMRDGCGCGKVKKVNETYHAQMELVDEL